MPASSSTFSSEKHTASPGGFPRFLRQAIVFLLCLVVADQLVGNFMHFLYFRQKAGPGAETTHIFNEMNEEGIILGSSRGRRNYNPEILADSLQISVYNAGHDGQTVFYEQAIIRKVLSRYTPKLVILDLNPEELYYRDLHYDRLNVLAPYYRDEPLIAGIYLLKGIRSRQGDAGDFFIRPEVKEGSSWDYFWNKLHSFEEYALPFNTEKVKMLSATYPYNSTLLDMLSGIFRNRKSQSGFKPLKGVISEKKAEELIRQNAELRLQPGKKIDANKIRGLEEIFSSLQERGTHVAVVMSPALAPFGQEPSYQAITELCEKYGVPFYDYSQDSSYARLDYFYDNHMNREGASLYSARLAHDIRRNFFPGVFEDSSQTSIPKPEN